MIDFLLRSYPVAWRERYGDELRDLLVDTGLTPAIALDVVRAGLGERVRAMRVATNGGLTMTLGPAWRHPSGWAAISMLVLAPTLLFVSMSILAYQLGLANLENVMEPISSWLQANRFADVVLVAAPAIALVLAVAPLVRLELRGTPSGREAVVGVRLRAANVMVGVLALVVGGLLIGHIVAETVIHAGP